MADWLVVVSLKTSVQVFVGVWIKEEVRAIETRYERCIVSGQTMRVEELASVVGVVTGFLYPEGQPCFVEALTDELRIST